MEPISKSSQRTLLIVAFVIVYVVWGSTYLAIRIAVETLPPFLMAACRFLIAGTGLLVLLKLRGVALPSKIQWRNAAIAGVLMLMGGNGLVVWAEQTTSSSLAALFVALTPVWFALLEWARPAGCRPHIQTLLGIVVGFSGVVLLVMGQDSNVSGDVNLWGMVALVLAGIFWAAGSLWSRYSAHPESPWMNAATQMICGGAGLTLLGLCMGESKHFHAEYFSTRSLVALVYLILFGSWIAFSAYVWLLKASTPARVATYAYMNPVIAVFLGRIVLGEPLSNRTVWAALVILAGVIITTLPKRRAKGN
jgi:drug/metabolite transporter (DMT)-like permease